MLVAAKTYALISEYALICDMRLITREYGNIIYSTSTVDLEKNNSECFVCRCSIIMKDQASNY